MVVETGFFAQATHNRTLTDMTKNNLKALRFFIFPSPLEIRVPKQTVAVREEPS